MCAYYKHIYAASISMLQTCVSYKHIYATNIHILLTYVYYKHMYATNICILPTYILLTYVYYKQTCYQSRPLSHRYFSNYSWLFTSKTGNLFFYNSKKYISTQI